mgnify:FL=1
MSVKLDGRTRRHLALGVAAIRQFNKSSKNAIQPHPLNIEIYITLMVIIIGGVFLMVGTFLHNRIIYWFGLIIIVLLGIYLLLRFIRV